MFIKKTATVDFDPSNKAHRAAVSKFLERGAWGDSPMRFTHDPEYGSVADQVKTRVAQWFLSREFSKPTKMAQVGDEKIAVDLIGIASEHKD